MGVQDRDWYRDELRKKQGYVERSAFRRSLGKPKAFGARQSGSWGRFAMQLLTVAVAVLVVFVMLVRFSRSQG